MRKYVARLRVWRPQKDATSIVTSKSLCDKGQGCKRKARKTYVLHHSVITADLRLGGSRTLHCWKQTTATFPLILNIVIFIFIFIVVYSVFAIVAVYSIRVVAIVISVIVVTALFVILLVFDMTSLD